MLKSREQLNSEGEERIITSHGNEEDKYTGWLSAVTLVGFCLISCDCERCPGMFTDFKGPGN